MRALSPRLLAHPTEYHFLFWRIAEALQSGDDADLPLLGNAARRLLEGFISFKAPHQSDFQAKIEGAGKTGGVPNELIQRIVRFVHGSSHRGDPNPSASFDSVSIPDELTHVLRFIHACDRDHFDGMCRAVDVDMKAQTAAWAIANASERGERLVAAVPGGQDTRAKDISPSAPAATLPLD